MRTLILSLLLAFSVAAQAGQTLRIGQRVLTVGDTTTRAITLLGTPGYKEPVENKFGARVGERWQYARDDGHVVVLTIVDGKVGDIDDRRE
ncbi:hypothetical protein ASD55_03030 [Rhodanobacter sp. Root561]|uniref:DUF2845 domain-containing protein n=1 Tax=Rhodanobacter sp. Root561 TaxID=1736560 RepID=UPI0006FD860A|nr:DUF2845 domain-containing protein [Rhodanobacter sp. Root561]KQZ80302.1 hypothetical protein ASD55_03030 [Rhodanobacter sp. Root561]